MNAHRSFVFSKELGRVVEVDPRPLCGPRCPECGEPMIPREVGAIAQALADTLHMPIAAVKVRRDDVPFS